MWGLIYKHDTDELTYITEVDPQIQKIKLQLSKEKEGMGKLGIQG